MLLLCIFSSSPLSIRQPFDVLFPVRQGDYFSDISISLLLVVLCVVLKPLELPPFHTNMCIGVIYVQILYPGLVKSSILEEKLRLTLH